jgi:hypothetical protein
MKFEVFHGGDDNGVVLLGLGAVLIEAKVSEKLTVSICRAEVAVLGIRGTI